MCIHHGLFVLKALRYSGGRDRLASYGCLPYEHPTPQAGIRQAAARFGQDLVEAQENPRPERSPRPLARNETLVDGSRPYARFANSTLVYESTSPTIPPPAWSLQILSRKFSAKLTCRSSLCNSRLTGFLDSSIARAATKNWLFQVLLAPSAFWMSCSSRGIRKWQRET